MNVHYKYNTGLPNINEDSNTQVTVNWDVSYNNGSYIIDVSTTLPSGGPTYKATTSATDKTLDSAGITAALNSLKTQINAYISPYLTINNFTNEQNIVRNPVLDALCCQGSCFNVVRSNSFGVDQCEVDFLDPAYTDMNTVLYKFLNVSI